MKLYTYYRSQASFRVRIAMNLKALAHEDSFLHLEKGDQFDPAYKALNPQMVVPTLIDGGFALSESSAIASQGRRLARLGAGLCANQHRRLSPAPGAAHPPLPDR